MLPQIVLNLWSFHFKHPDVGLQLCISSSCGKPSLVKWQILSYKAEPVLQREGFWESVIQELITCGVVMRQDMRTNISSVMKSAGYDSQNVTSANTKKRVCFSPLIVSGLSLRSLLNAGAEQASVVLIEGFHQAKKSSITSQRMKEQGSGREQFCLTLWVSLVEGLHQCRAGLVSCIYPQPRSQIPGSVKMLTEDHLGWLQPILLIGESGPNEYCH